MRVLGLFTAILVSIMVFLAFEFTINYSKSKEITNAILLYNTLKKDPQEVVIQTYLKKHLLQALTTAQIKPILKKASYVIETPIYREVFQSGDIKLYRYKSYYYYALQVKKQWHYYKNIEKADNLILYIIIATLLLIILLVGIHLYIIKAIQPLKILHQKINTYANPSKSTDNKQTTQHAKDEVSEVSFAFDEATTRIQSLQANRTLFWQNVMHEFKTPLTQGMLMVSMMQEKNEHKEQLNLVFKRMQEQLDKLKQLEYLKAEVFKLNKQEVNMIDIIDDVKDILLIDDTAITYVPVHQSYKVDTELFMVALKNLISNALLYSSDKHVCIVHKQNHLYIINKGEPLAKPFIHYTEAFTQGQVNSGMGLGLHITKEILNKHHIALRYKYWESKHMIILSM
jgi:signal transduction histidine kinase